MPRRKTLISDADGVLVDFTQGICDLLPEGVLTPEMCTTWDFFDPKPKGLLTLEQSRHVIEELRHPDFWDSLRPIPGAIAAVATLRANDVDIRVATSPWRSFPAWGETRMRLLERLFKIDGKHVMATAEKHLVRGTHFLDDKPEHVEAWMAEGSGSARMFKTPYNAAHEGEKFRMHHVDGWDEVLAWVLE